MRVVSKSLISIISGSNYIPAIEAWGYN